FSSWSGSVTESINPLNVMMDADKVITATFSPIPTYQVAVEVAGQGSVTPPGGTFLSNTVVMFSANPAAGWVFGRWTGDVSSLANPLELSVSNDTHLTAVFGQPPAISSQPQSATVDAGGTVVFQVEAQGSQPFAYEWQKDGLPLEGATSASLQIANVRAADAGEYQVTVSNDYGATLSQGATLTLGNSCGGPNVVTACNEAQLREAVSRGGVVRFCCNGTIILTDTIEITHDVALDAQQFAVSISGDNAVRLFKILTNVQFSATNLLLINGRHVGTNGTAAPPQPGEDGLGGAILNQGGTVHLVSCVLSNNSSQGGRAAVPPEPTSPMAAAGMGRGGAIMNMGGTVYLDSVLAVSNSTVGGFASNPFFVPVAECGPGFGGALGSVQGAVVISDSMFIGNTSLGLAAQIAARA
ncbi:MAG TPA: immunoglobulin domain-containing protein, partial [Candidatus Dormibacteraeota bacterium]|nr:immunoglobulin domain-containing protein [Candidatus Dormibacteraeota bacterium]